MENRELLNLLEAEERAAIGGGEGGDVQNRRARNIRYYKGKPLGDEDENHSSVIINTTAETIDNMLPSMLRIFASRGNAVMFDPVGPEDIQASKNETKAVQTVFWKQCDGYVVLHNWLKDGLREINGVVSVIYDKSEKKTREAYENLTAEQVQRLEAEKGMVAVETLIEEDFVAQMTPEGVAFVPSQTFDVVFERTEMVGKVSIDNVRPDRFRISNDSVKPYIEQDVRFVAEIQYPTRQELIDFGISRDVVMGLQALDADLRDLTEEARARRTDSIDEQEPLTIHPLNQRIEVLNAYPLVDYDGDGDVERRQVMTASHQIIYNEPVDAHPYIGWTPKIEPHEYLGICPADEVIDYHEIDTTLVRQTLDNIYLVNEPRAAVWEQALGDATLDDLLNGGAGDPIRFARPVNESYANITTPFVAGQSFPILDFMMGSRQRRTGVGEGAEGLEMDSLKNIQQGVLGQASDLKMMMVEMIARNFAETGFRRLFLKIHELLQKHHDAEMMVRLVGDDWVPTNPSEWRERTDMTVMVGLGTATRQHRLLHLTAIADIMERMSAAGMAGRVVTEQNAYNLGQEYVENAMLPGDDNMFFTDPSALPPPQPQPDPTMEAIKMQGDIEGLKAEVKQLEIELADAQKQRQLDIDQFEAETKAAQVEGDQAFQRTELEVNTGTDIPGSEV